MSHYGLNSGVPKTLVQYLIRWCMRQISSMGRPRLSCRRYSKRRSRLNWCRRRERRGAEHGKPCKLACDLLTIRHWLENFLLRFFATSQIKRSLAHGPRVSAAGALSSRGDWRASSGAAATVWVTELAAAFETAEKPPLTEKGIS
jgi:NH3-dependent NAD+ synthetase